MDTSNSLAFASWSVVLAATMAVAAVIYTGFTIWLSIETHRLRRAQTDPCVIAYLRPSSRDASWPELVVENSGGGAAFRVRFSFDEAASSALLGDDARRVLNTSIDTLAPKSRFVVDLHHLGENGHEMPEQALEMRANFARDPGLRSKRLEVASVLSTRSLFGMTLETNADPLRLIVQELRDLRQSIEVASRASGKGRES